MHCLLNYISFSLVRMSFVSKLPGTYVTVSYIFIMFQLCTDNYFKKNIQTHSPCFHKEALQGTLEIIWSNILLNGSGYPGSCQAKSWFFPAREISPLLWAYYSSCSHGEDIFSYIQDRISPEATIPIASSPTTMQPCKERTSTLSVAF